MRHFLIIGLVFFVAFDSFGQIRRRDRASTPSTESGNLNYSNPTEYTIAGIEVTGLNILDKNAMISISGLKVGDKVKIPGDAVSGAIRKIWKYGLVGDVAIQVSRIDGSNVYLNIV